ncbi:hypothetical protein IWZ03DRAFT_371487, partial [Phyllosticta citriasiana]
MCTTRVFVFSSELRHERTCSPLSGGCLPNNYNYRRRGYRASFLSQEQVMPKKAGCATLSDPLSIFPSRRGGMHGRSTFSKSTDPWNQTSVSLRVFNPLPAMLGTIPWDFDNPFSSSGAVFFPWDRVLPPTNQTLFTPAAARHTTASVSLNWGKLLGIETDGSTRAKERQGLEYCRTGNFFCLCSGDVGAVMDCLGRPFSFLWTTFSFSLFFFF